MVVQSVRESRDAAHVPFKIRLKLIKNFLGLIIAYQLARFSAGTLSVHVVERYPKAEQDVFGRAVTFWCRSMEMLDQIGLAQEITQQCFACRTAASFDWKGTEVHGRAWSFVEDISDTKWDFASVLRQKYVEEILRAALARYGITVHAPAEFLSMEIDESIPSGAHRVTATIQDSTGAQPQPLSIKARYIIGADGSRTTVRPAAHIATDGDTGEDKWVRIDGLLRTNHPKPRAYGSIESQTHGNVLWVPIDRRCTRIGFAFSAARMAQYPGGFSREVAVAEAKAAVQPFEIDYERVDWASIYVVGQRVARDFYAKGCVFLAGDSCHTHSSGAGQGMNTGVHDAVNLAWKLFLVLRGVAKPVLLDTYEHERRPNALKLIGYDKAISALISHRLPPSWNGDPEADPNQVLAEVLKSAKGFNTGLAISFEENLLNVRAESQSELGTTLTPVDTIPTPATAGYRGPDVVLQCPATFEATRLHAVTPNTARFHVVVFAGDVATAGKDTRSSSTIHFQRFVEGLFSSTYFSRSITSHEIGPMAESSQTSLLPINFLTILAGQASGVYEVLDLVPPVGRVYFDRAGEAHRRYGIDVADGGAGKIVVLRPDGWIGMVIGLDEGDGIVGRLEDYFKGFLI